MAQSATELLSPGGGPLPVTEGGPSVEARSPRQLFWARFKEDKLAMFGAFLVFLMVAVAIAAPLFENLVGHPFDEIYNGKGDEPMMINEFGSPVAPNSDFIFGSDDLGRDLFVRVLYGGRVSLTIAIIATGLQVMIGVLVGMLAGFRRGWVDTLMSRVIDLILSVPLLLLGIALGVSLDWDGRILVIFLLVVFGWPYIARIVRGQTLSLRESQFVEAAYSIGAGSRWIMFREILPNLIAPIIIYATLIIPVNIVSEASLSFLGVGVQEPTPAWGTMLSRAVDFTSYGAAWWYMFWPGFFLFLTVLGFNLFGDGLRDALDPKSNR